MSNNLNDIKAVFFDWDGTLVDSFAFLHRAHNHVRSVFGMEPFSLEVFDGYFGQPREKLYTDIYGDKREEAKTHFEAFVKAHHANDLKPIEGAEKILEWFDEMDIPCGVVTNKKSSLVKAEIEVFGWSKYFVSVVGAGEAEADKPSHAPLKLAVERAALGPDVTPENILFVGDTDNDLACANKFGAPTVLLSDMALYNDLISKYQVDYHFMDCLSFYDFLLQSGRNSLKAKTVG